MIRPDLMALLRASRVAAPAVALFLALCVCSVNGRKILEEAPVPTDGTPFGADSDEMFASWANKAPAPKPIKAPSLFGKVFGR